LHGHTELTSKEIFSTSLRSHLCGSLRAADAGSKVALAGWVHRSRNLGGLIFIDLRDREGIVQVSVNPSEVSAQLAETAAAVGAETVIRVEGEVVRRPAEMRNADMGTGEIEVKATSIRILSPAETPAIPVARGKGEKLPAEDLRLRYRHLDLRRPELQKNLFQRHKLMQATRRYLDANGYIEVETPILTKPTPEGARDYLVPSRVHAGEFYALPQSPQLYKQLLMVSGFDRYFQIARCFRDEDLRADRQPEFTQIDIEASFIDREDIMKMTQGLMSALWDVAGVKIPDTFPRLTYADAMERYGSDRPDLRYDLQIRDYSDVFRGVDFAITSNALTAGARVRGIRIPGGGSLSRKQVDEIEGIAKTGGAKGLLRLKKTANGLEGPVAKFLDEAAAARFELAEGDLLLLSVDNDAVTSVSLDRVRQDVAQRLGLVDDTKREFLWVTDFPLFGRNDDGSVSSVHHPFTSPHPDDLHMLESEPDKVRALAYDVILNGTELGGGSIRIHDPAVQSRVFKVLGLSEESAKSRFGFLLEALASGAPPHGGIAFGFDRISMLIAGGQSLRDVIAFPKTTAARALFENAPSLVPEKDINDLHLELKKQS
jgi:aspartyl-tRNA synthetase